MKLYITKIILGTFFLLTTLIPAQNISENKYLVKGNCEMCKERIESTALKAGAKKAIYSIDKQTLTLETSANILAEDILKKIAEAGHDNE
ncbi:MAG: TonB-dependent receptor, partial [Chryseobacterium sp.]